MEEFISVFEDRGIEMIDSKKQKEKDWKEVSAADGLWWKPADRPNSRGN